MNFDEQRQMHDATCADCGNATQVPFEPRGDRPVYCRDCFQKHRNEHSSDAPRQREMHPAVCASCGQETTVPFKPSGDRPVYCRDCFQKQRG